MEESNYGSVNRSKRISCSLLSTAEATAVASMNTGFSTWTILATSGPAVASSLHDERLTFRVCDSLENHSVLVLPTVLWGRLQRQSHLWSIDDAESIFLTSDISVFFFTVDQRAPSHCRTATWTVDDAKSIGLYSGSELWESQHFCFLPIKYRIPNVGLGRGFEVRLRQLILLFFGLSPPQQPISDGPGRRSTDIETAIKAVSAPKTAKSAGCHNGPIEKAVTSKRAWKTMRISGAWCGPAP
ncbi:hypothetical protein FPQ18DRAFT_300783 [Pyronema domesticum]|nr:hypothetical protein FPQ18DRAFT_300783 [Pyronema domesticum]